MRVERLVCALAGATLLVVGSYADTANNSFASVSGDGVVADGESGFCIENVEGSVNVTVGERPGWKCEKGTPFSYDHNEGDVDYFKFYGLDDEESVTIAISNIWVCVHDTTNNEEHVSAPGAVIPDSVHMLGAYFWPREEGCKLYVATNMTIVGTLGHHTNKVFAVPCPNPKCDYGKKENPIGGNDVEIDPSPVIAYLSSGNLQEDGSLLLDCGEHTIGYSAHYTNDCKDCEFGVSFDYLRIDVCKVESTAGKYIGLDRTDAGYGKDHTITGAVSLTHAPGGVRCLWTVKPHCKIDGNDNEASVLAKVKRIAGEVPGGWDFEYSDSYEQEHLMCEVKLKDGCNPPCESGAGTENDFTIVKVDVTIDDVPETIEEAEGAFTYYVPDDDAPIWAEEWTNSLKDVSITCEPHDGEMAKQTVKLTFDDEFLWVEKDDGTVEKAKHSYTIEELNKTKFKLHGHKVSEGLRDNEVRINHPLSGATDVAKFTCISFDWIKSGCDKMPPTGTFGLNPETFEGPCLDFGMPDSLPPFWWLPGTYQNPQSKALKVFFKFIKNAEDEPGNFTIMLDAQIRPNDFVRQCSLKWTETEGPEEIEPVNAHGLHAEIKNPKKTGLYKYRLTASCDGVELASEAWFMLPRAGGEISEWLVKEVPVAQRRARAWSRDVRRSCLASGMNRREVNDFVSGKAWRYIASSCFDYQGVAGDATPRYSYTDKDRPRGKAEGFSGEGQGSDFDEPSYATLKGIVVHRAKINNLLYCVWGRVLGHSTADLKWGARWNALMRLQWDNPQSQAAVELGGSLYDNSIARNPLAPLITKDIAKTMQTQDSAEGLNDVNLWPNNKPAPEGFSFPAMPTNCDTLSKGDMSREDKSRRGRESRTRRK